MKSTLATNQSYSQIAKLFPNPTNGYKTILLKSDPNGQYNYTFTNLLGQNIVEQKQTGNTLTIDLSALRLAKGLYFVNVTEVNNKQCYKTKFVYEK